jgi:hypothetical protein
MTLEVIIRELMQPLTIITSVDNGVQVSTHCLYPSNGAVSVFIRKYMDSYVVSDDGGAVDEATSSGLKIPDANRKIKHIVSGQGLIVKDNIISSPKVSLEAVPAAILLVANASKDAAEWMLEHIKFTIPRNFKKDVADLLSKYFHDSLKHDQHVLGRSNKRHNFGHVVYLSGERRLLVDAVSPDPQSIYAKAIANLDVKMLGDEKTIQRLIYDDFVQWKSSDLRLLELGAIPVPFSRANDEVARLAA